jgi:hypothetical protein
LETKEHDEAHAPDAIANLNLSLHYEFHRLSDSPVVNDGNRAWSTSFVFLFTPQRIADGKKKESKSEIHGAFHFCLYGGEFFRLFYHFHPEKERGGEM